MAAQISGGPMKTWQTKSSTGKSHDPTVYKGLQER